MATSSLSKSFVINSKSEASNLVKMFEESEKNPVNLTNNVVVNDSFSKEQLEKIINATLKRK